MSTTHQLLHVLQLPTSPIKVHLPLPGINDLCSEIDLNGNFLGFDISGNYLEGHNNDNFIDTDVNSNLSGDNPNDSVPPDKPLNWPGLFLMAKVQPQ